MRILKGTIDSVLVGTPEATPGDVLDSFWDDERGAWIANAAHLGVEGEGIDDEFGDVVIVGLVDDGPFPGVFEETDEDGDLYRVHDVEVWVTSRRTTTPNRIERSRGLTVRPVEVTPRVTVAFVESSNGVDWYAVTLGATFATCTCPDGSMRDTSCKHVVAVAMNELAATMTRR